MAYGTREAAPGLDLGWGADFRYQQGRLVDTPGAEWSKREGGAYLTAEYSMKEVVILSAGYRYNRDEIAGAESSPSFGIVYRPSAATSIRGIVSSGFRSPQINELYMYPSSNPDLDAERVWNYEAGFRQALAGGIDADISVFRTEGRNMIELVANAESPPPFMFENTGSFEFTGAELSLSGKWRCGMGGSFSYSWLDPGDWTAGRPGSKLDMELSMRRGRYLLEMRGQRVDKYYAGNGSTLRIDPYTVIDLYAEAGMASGVRFFAGVDNVLDEQYNIYADLAGGSAGLFSMPGISLSAGIKYDL